jgi:alkaline phosphatase D
LAAVGDVTPTSAVVAVRGVRAGDVAVEWGPAGATPLAAVTVPIGPDTDQTGRLTLERLRPATRYAYRVQQDSDALTGEFVTAPAADEAVPVTFQWSGDLGGGGVCRRRDGGFRVFEAMVRRRPDFFVFLGDTIYADHRCTGPAVVPGAEAPATTLDGFRRKHRYNREDPALAAFLARTSVVAIWDDHDVRNDFAGPSEPLMPLGRRAFTEYWPIRRAPDDPFRLYRKLGWGKLLDLFVLDTRQYRSPNAERDGAGKTMLGAVQRGWLIDAVSSSSAIWKIVASTVPLSIPTGRNARDSWSNATIWGLPEEGTGFAAERDAILAELRRRRVRNLVFIVADVHHAEIIRHRPWPDFTVYELVAGPLAATFGRPRPLDSALNPTSLFADTGINNFGEIVVERARLTVRIVDEAGAVLFTHVVPAE